MYQNEWRKTGKLYDKDYEHDACGIGAIVNIDGRQDHETVGNALAIVERLEHRAGKDAAGETGDGVGILLQIPHAFFREILPQFNLGEVRDYGVGMFFFPQEELRRNQAKNMFEIIVKKGGMEFIGWREVPVNPDVLGERARSCMPSIWQGLDRKSTRLNSSHQD